MDLIKKNGPTTPGLLAKRLSITPQALHRHLALLCQEGGLKKVGRAPHTRYEVGGSVPELSPLSRRIVTEAKEVLAAHPAIVLVTLFGSYVRGEQGPKSDVDLFIWLAPDEPFTRQQIWDYWDRQARGLPWRNRASLIVQRWSDSMNIHTLLLDLPEEHLPVADRGGYFTALRNAVVDWRKENGSERIESFGGTHAWKYSSTARSLDEIDFTLVIKRR